MPMVATLLKQFTVTGTTTLGSDSVGKGELLKISIADWIDFKPEFDKDRWHPLSETVDAGRT